MSKVEMEWVCGQDEHSIDNVKSVHWRHFIAQGLHKNEIQEFAFFLIKYEPKRRAIVYSHRFIYPHNTTKSTSYSFAEKKWTHSWPSTTEWFKWNGNNEKNGTTFSLHWDEKKGEEKTNTTWHWYFMRNKYFVAHDGERKPKWYEEAESKMQSWRFFS